MNYRITTYNACFGVETDDNGIIVNTTFTAPIAKRYCGKHINKIKNMKKENSPLPVYHSQEYQKLKSGALEIPHYLNRISGKNIPDADSSLQFIIQRLHEGYLHEQFIEVIDKKNKDPDFCKNLMRPNTLFKDKIAFDKYLNEDPEFYGNQKPGRKKMAFETDTETITHTADVQA